MILGQNFNFIENPKTASTSIHRALLEKTGTMAIGRKHDTLATVAKAFPMTKNRFVIVRNPWDRLVSLFFYSMKRRGDEADDRIIMKFGRFVKGGAWLVEPNIDVLRVPQLYWEHRTTKTILFERIDEDLPDYLFSIGIEIGPIPRYNGSSHPPYREMYTKEIRDIVADRFYPDIEAHKYTF